MPEAEGGGPTFPKHDYDEYPKTLAPDDFWGQVRRTVNGAPIDDEQISLIVAAVRRGLQFDKNDGLLDIACGNGALSREFFDDIASFYGVDSSEYLIQVANRNFARLPNFTFERMYVRELLDNTVRNVRITKALCYGSYSYFNNNDAKQLVCELPLKFPKLKKLYIGNIPDIDRAHNFFRIDKVDENMLHENKSQIGIWRSQIEMERLAESAGWSCEVVLMPSSFYASHYRFDAILSRPKPLS